MVLLLVATSAADEGEKEQRNEAHGFVTSPGTSRGQPAIRSSSPNHARFMLVPKASKLWSSLAKMGVVFVERTRRVGRLTDASECFEKWLSTTAEVTTG